MFSVYVIESEVTAKYYVGYTSDLGQRLNYHNRGKNKSTKNGVPWKLVWHKNFVTKKEAWLRESQIKRYKGGKAFKKLVGSRVGWPSGLRQQS